MERICPICLAYMYLDINMIGWMRCPSCGYMKKELKSMITMKELLGDTKIDDLTDELKKNAAELLMRVNKFRTEYGKPMYVTSGYRTPEHNIKIGGSKNSAHCKCQAVDFKDGDGELKKFIAADLDILVRCDLYMEDPNVTTTWIHLSSRSTVSGKRVFKP